MPGKQWCPPAAFGERWPRPAECPPSPGPGALKPAAASPVPPPLLWWTPQLPTPGHTAHHPFACFQCQCIYLIQAPIYFPASATAADDPSPPGGTLHVSHSIAPNVGRRSDLIRATIIFSASATAGNPSALIRTPRFGSLACLGRVGWGVSIILPVMLLHYVPRERQCPSYQLDVAGME